MNILVFNCGGTSQGFKVYASEGENAPRVIASGKAHHVAAHTRAGPLGLSGFSSNLEEILAEAEKGNLECKTAFWAYTNRLKHYLGAFTWLLGRADAILFTDDVGMRFWKLRQEVCTGAESLGVVLDADANRLAPVDEERWVSCQKLRTQIWLIPTDKKAVIMSEVCTRLR